MRTTNIRFALAFCLASVVAQAQPQTPEETKNGRWTMQGRWVNDSTYGTLIADLPRPEVYKVCRSKMVGQASVGTSELYVYVDDRRLDNYSLDHGSCVIARGKKFALRYDGSDVSLEHLLNGPYERLEEETFEYVSYAHSSFWTMSWVREETQHHEVVLVKDVAGDYRVCIDKIEAQLQDGQPGWLALAVKVDEQFLTSFGDTVPYRQGNCVDVRASTITVRMKSWSPYMSYFFAEGSLLRKKNVISVP